MSNFSLFKYFILFYRGQINGGGTFSTEELVEIFMDAEPKNKQMQLIEEAKQAFQNLQLEDWEKDSSILELCDKVGQNTLKYIVDVIIEATK
jgi:hypothetical protein